jgi:hypothetical protein
VYGVAFLEMMAAMYGHGWWLARLALQRGMGALYLGAFLAIVYQFRPLLGSRGLQPVPEYLRFVGFREAPSIFHWCYSDRFALSLGWLGVLLSVLVVTGLSELGPLWLSLSIWLALYAIYLSFVNVGQRFYSFGWESMLLEAGFFTAFLGPSWMRAPLIPVLILRWMLFRVELGAGLIKLRHDPCWRDLTCLYYHYETQPMPNPLSWYFHHFPRRVHRMGVVFSHFVQIVVPFGLFLPEPVAAISGGLMILHQLMLIVSGNYAWLNWMTVVLGFSAVADSTLGISTPGLPVPPAFRIVLYILAAVTVWLSVKPTLNLFSSEQAMNLNYNPLHLVGSYGAFGSMTRERYEVVLEGTTDPEVGPETVWHEYPFKGKPGDPYRRPPQWAPYHLRLDWLMWFLPFSVRVFRGRVLVGGYEEWFLRLVRGLLLNDPAPLSLLAGNPFVNRPPTFVRARYFRYHFTTAEERRQSGAWWSREAVGDYLPPVRLPEQPEAREAGPLEMAPTSRPTGWG